MEFNNLLTSLEIETLITSIFPNERADIIYSKLKNSLIIQGEDKLFLLQSNNTYKENSKFSPDSIIDTVSKLIMESFKKLSKLESDLIVLKYPKTYSLIFKNSFTSSFYPQLTINLKETHIFNNTSCEIHYNNGFIDLYDLQLKQRVLGKHYITNYINRDYIKSTEIQQEEIMKIIKIIYTNKDDIKSMLLLLGSCLSGKTTAEQDLMFLCGTGSSGKSFLMELTSLTIECYLKELKDDTFSQANSKIDKILNSFADNAQIRITWINEPKDVRFDDSLFKTFCDGKLQTTKLYAEGSHTTQHYSKLFFTMNNFPNLKLDTGMIRRIKSCTHKSKFTHNTNEINETKHIYKRDDNLLSNIQKNNLLDAWFDILALNCKSWLNGEKIKYNSNFQETTETIISSNDIIQDFIDEKLSLTNNEKDRIGKEEMHKLFISKYPNKRITQLQLISDLKAKNIKYDRQMRANRVQGCFYGVKVYNDLDDDLINYDNYSENKNTLIEDNKSIEILEENINFIDLNNDLLTKNIKLVDENKKQFDEIQKLQQMIKELQQKQKLQDLNFDDINNITDILFK